MWAKYCDQLRSKLVTLRGLKGTDAEVRMIENELTRAELARASVQRRQDRRAHPSTAQLGLDGGL